MMRSMVFRAELSSMSTALTELAERITKSPDAMLGCRGRKEERIQPSGRIDVVPVEIPLVELPRRACQRAEARAAGPQNRAVHIEKEESFVHCVS